MLRAVATAHALSLGVLLALVAQPSKAAALSAPSPDVSSSLLHATFGRDATRQIAHRWRPAPLVLHEDASMSQDAAGWPSALWNASDVSAGGSLPSASFFVAPQRANQYIRTMIQCHASEQVYGILQSDPSSDVDLALYVVQRGSTTSSASDGKAVPPPDELRSVLVGHHVVDEACVEEVVERARAVMRWHRFRFPHKRMVIRDPTLREWFALAHRLRCEADDL